MVKVQLKCHFFRKTFFQQIFIESLLSAGLYSEGWGHSSEQRESPYSRGIYILGVGDSH